MGKSTIAAEIFSELKKIGFIVELTGEFAKDVVYEKSNKILDDQLYVFANQAHRLRNFARYGVKVAVCDAPLLLSLAYQKPFFEPKSFSALVKEEFERYQNINYFISRDDSFWKKDKRRGNLSQAKFMDDVIFRILSEYDFKVLKPEEVMQEVMNSVLGGEIR